MIGNDYEHENEALNQKGRQALTESERKRAGTYFERLQRWLISAISGVGDESTGRGARHRHPGLKRRRGAGETARQLP